jgi:hypothetical protein
LPFQSPLRLSVEPPGSDELGRRQNFEEYLLRNAALAVGIVKTRYCFKWGEIVWSLSNKRCHYRIYQQSLQEVVDRFRVHERLRVGSTFSAGSLHITAENALSIPFLASIDHKII